MCAYFPDSVVYTYTCTHIHAHAYMCMHTSFSLLFYSPQHQLLPWWTYEMQESILRRLTNLANLGGYSCHSVHLCTLYIACMPGPFICMYKHWFVYVSTCVITASERRIHVHLITMSLCSGGDFPIARAWRKWRVLDRNVHASIPVDGARRWSEYTSTFSCMQLRREARLRREYLYRKSIEDRERTILERKRKVKEALEGWRLC